MKKRIMIVGLGYVGLQLASAFSKCQQYDVIGYDVDMRKVESYQHGKDITGEIGDEIQTLKIQWCSNIDEIPPCDFYVITVPTPTKSQIPDYTFVDSATKAVAQHMQKGAIVIYESTYPPYTTEQRCVPMLQRYSKLVPHRDFTFAYSPERVNPGDKAHPLAQIVKLVAASDEITESIVLTLYQSIIENVVSVTTIATAEAAKILENAQRDLNIALLNQFSMLYDGIQMQDLIKAMSTKWNALGFHNGLVGGHCVAEDPYYLIEQQLQQKTHFSLLEEARDINEKYVVYIFNRITQWITKNEPVLFYGLTFKPNTPDTRNSKALEIYLSLQQRGYKVYAVDPYQDEIKFILDETLVINFATEQQIQTITTRIYAVGHQEFINEKISATVKKIIDIPSCLKVEVKTKKAYYTF